MIEQEGDIETSIGEIEQSPISEKNKILSSKDKADKEFLSQISYLQGMSDVVSTKTFIIEQLVMIYALFVACQHEDKASIHQYPFVNEITLKEGIRIWG